MNVQPGDFARIIEGENSNVMVLVLDDLPLNPEGLRIDPVYLAKAAAHFGSKLWRVELLQHADIWEMAGKKIMRRGPGYKVQCPDSWLRRIDPPEDTDEVFRDAPIDDEERNAEIVRRFFKETKHA